MAWVLELATNRDCPGARIDVWVDEVQLAAEDLVGKSPRRGRNVDHACLPQAAWVLLVERQKLHVVFVDLGLNPDR